MELFLLFVTYFIPCGIVALMAELEAKHDFNKWTIGGKIEHVKSLIFFRFPLLLCVSYTYLMVVSGVYFEVYRLLSYHIITGSIPLSFIYYAVFENRLNINQDKPFEYVGTTAKTDRFLSKYNLVKYKFDLTALGFFVSLGFYLHTISR